MRQIFKSVQIVVRNLRTL